MIIMTDDLLAIDRQAQILVKALIESSHVDKYRTCQQNLANNIESQEKIKAFAIEKNEFEKIAPYGKHAPGYREKNKIVRQLKRTMDTDDQVAAFRFAEMDLQTVLDEISFTLAQQVSGNIKVPTGNPFFETRNGGCSSGGHCSNCG